MEKAESNRLNRKRERNARYQRLRRQQERARKREVGATGTDNVSVDVIPMSAQTGCSGLVEIATPPAKVEVSVEPPKDDCDTILFQDENKIDEDVTLVARAIANDWGVPAKMRRKAVKFFDEVLDKETVKDTTKLAVVRSLIALDKLRLEAAKVDIVVRKEEEGRYGRLGAVEQSSPAVASIEENYDAMLEACTSVEELDALIRIRDRAEEALRQKASSHEETN